MAELGGRRGWSAGLTPTEKDLARRRFDVFGGLLGAAQGPGEPLPCLARAECYECGEWTHGIPRYVRDSPHCLCPLCVVQTDADKRMHQKLNAEFAGIDEERLRRQVTEALGGKRRAKMRPPPPKGSEAQKRRAQATLRTVQETMRQTGAERPAEER